MGKHRKIVMVSLIGALATAAVLAGISYNLDRASPATSAEMDNVRVLDDPKPSRKWAIDTAYGRGALSNLRAALGEIDAANADEAREGVAVARSLLGRIASEPSEPSETFVLVHSEVRVLGDADPGNEVEATLASLRARIDMNDHDAIVAALEALNIPLAYTRIDLPLREARTLVDEALQALDARDPALARAKLLQVGERLRVDTVRLGIEAHRIESGDAQGAS